MGEREKAQEVVDELVVISKQRYVSPYAGLGEIDLGLEWLERAYEERVGELVLAKSGSVTR